LKVPAQGGLLGQLDDLFRVYRGRPLDSGGGSPRVAVILGAQVLRGGRPSRTLEARTSHAGEMYARGELDLLVPTGGMGEHPPAEADAMSGILRAMGVPERAILREGTAGNTWESAVRVAEISRCKGITQVLVVSDPLHCVRVVSAFERAGLSAVAEPAYGSPMWRKKWSRRGQLARECAALAWYRLRYGVGGPFRPQPSGRS
jgi:vancomycin permeability regulator SanA